MDYIYYVDIVILILSLIHYVYNRLRDGHILPHLNRIYIRKMSCFLAICAFLQHHYIHLVYVKKKEKKKLLQDILHVCIKYIISYISNHYKVVINNTNIETTKCFYSII